jgi:alpha-D-ribose 1-methylphosphonate 5-triphosphate diphosphatase
LTEQKIDLLSIGAVEPGKGQFTSPDTFIEWYSTNETNCREPDYTAQEAQQYVSKNPQTVDGMLNSRIKEIADKARSSEVVLASHDDESSVEVSGMCQHGAMISEYPVTLEAAMTANESGMTTAMGAPNLFQDGSLFGNLDAAKAIDSGLLDVLCVDYYPPSMLASVFVDTGEALHQRVSRVTKKPADAVGLTDRGRLEAGCRADIVVIDPNPYPTVEYVFVGGKPLYQKGST